MSPLTSTSHSSQVTVRPVSAGDEGAIVAIYNHYVATTVVTFEEVPVSEAEMARRVGEVLALPLPWLVADIGGQIVGYAYATRWRARAAYRHSVETTVYVAAGLHGRGIGTALYAALLSRLGALDIHAVIGGVALPNDASVGLHERHGFRKVAHFERVGFKLGRWVDVGYWERLLERHEG